MATKKKMLQAAAGNAGGAAEAGLNVEDVFSTYLYEGNGGGQLIQNGIQLGQSGVGGSIEFDGASGLTFPTVGNSNFDFSAGTDFTMEAWIFPIEGRMIIVTTCGNTTNDAGIAFFTNASTFTLGAFEYVSNSVMITGTAAVPFGQWSHVAITREGTTLRLFLNGNLDQTASDNTSFNPNDGAGSVGTQSTNISLYSNGYFSDVRVVNGTAVYTANFTPPTTALTAITNTVLLIGQGDDPLTDNSSVDNTLTQIGNPTAATFGPFDSGEAGEGGLVWIKNRDASDPYILSDTERGATERLSSDATSAEITDPDTVTDFNSNGFSIGDDVKVNTNNEDYVSWTFRKAPKFFDVVTYTGDGNSSQTISHNLGSVPGHMAVKPTSTTGNWRNYHRTIGATGCLFLNLTNATNTNISQWSNTEPTDSSFTVGINSNASGATYVAYLFAHNDGDGEFGPDGDADIIKCGSYAGTGVEGTEIDIGFEPQWLLIKEATGVQNWWVMDAMRTMPEGQLTPRLRLNISSAESATLATADVTSTGFKVYNPSSVNTSGETYIYIAIRRGTKVPESGTEVFSPVTYTGDGVSGRVIPAGFTVDATISMGRTQYSNPIMDRLRGSGILAYLNISDGEYVKDRWALDEQDGVRATTIGADGNASGDSRVHWNWKRAPSFFDVVAYTGNGTAGRTVNHNLGVAPEMMWVKCRNQAYPWKVFHTTVGAGASLELNSTAVPDASTVYWNDTAPTESAFSLGTAGNTNGNTETFIAYLFASLDGVSKVFSVTKSSGSDASVNCGFSAGPRFVLLKRTDSTGDWYNWNTARGIVAGDDPYVLLNAIGNEVTNTDYIDPDSSGFAVTNNTNVNASGGEYIFLAIA